MSADTKPRAIVLYDVTILRLELPAASWLARSITRKNILVKEIRCLLAHGDLGLCQGKLDFPVDLC